MSIIGDVTKMFNEEILEEDLYPASCIQTHEDKEKYELETGKKLCLFTDIQKVASLLEVDAEDIYFTSKGMEAYYYYKFPAFVSIISMQPEIMNENGFYLNQIKEQIRVRYERFSEDIREGNYLSFFANADTRIHLLGFHKLYWKVPKEERYEFFVEIYTNLDYGFSRFDTRIIEDAFSNRSESVLALLKQKLDLHFKEDVIRVYRGVSEHSTPLHQAMSWTTDLYRASRFSSFFTGEGEVYTGLVRKEDVLDFITSRNEQEIIVFPKNVKHLENFDMVQTSVEIERMQQNGAIDIYCHYIDFFDESLFFHPDGIHGMKHMKRVLLHVLSLSKELQLSDADTRILSFCAAKHDIGRTHDYRDDTHGYKSWRKIKELRIIEDFEDFWDEDFNFDSSEMTIIQFIIENHCLDDKTVWKNLENLNSPEKERIERLTKIFKDSDNLDRVRLGDLDASYLRLPESKRRINFAFGLLRGVE